MRTFLLGLSIWALFTFLWARPHYVCKIKHLCQETPIAANNTDANLFLPYNGKNVLEGYEQFKFADKDATPQLSANNELFLQKTAEWLKANPDKNLTITGRYLESEKDVSAGMFENLGLARADAVRSLLVKLGIPKERIDIDHQMVSGDKLPEPISFLANDATVADQYNNTGEKLTKAQYNFSNMTYSDANFEYDSDVFKPGTAFKSYADSLKTYIQQHPDKTLHIIGHTDNIGSDSYNDNLGLRRARSTQKFLQKLGIKAKITTASMGKKEPIATNSSDEGRQKNRRVNVQIK